MVGRWDEIKRGRINHGFHGTVANYAPEFAGNARGTDGTLKGFPRRAGDILRLRPEVLDRWAPGTPGRIIAQACRDYGVYLGDRSSWDGSYNAKPGTFPLSQDRRWYTGEGSIPPLGTWTTTAMDWEVLAQ